MCDDCVWTQSPTWDDDWGNVEPVEHSYDSEYEREMSKWEAVDKAINDFINSTQIGSFLDEKCTDETCSWNEEQPADWMRDIINAYHWTVRKFAEERVDALEQDENAPFPTDEEFITEVRSTLEVADFSNDEDRKKSFELWENWMSEYDETK